MVEDLAANGTTLLVNILSNIPILMKNSYLAKLTAPWFNEPVEEDADKADTSFTSTGTILTNSFLFFSNYYSHEANKKICVLTLLNIVR